MSPLRPFRQHSQQKGGVSRLCGQDLSARLCTAAERAKILWMSDFAEKKAKERSIVVLVPGTSTGTCTDIHRNRTAPHEYSSWSSKKFVAWLAF